MGQREVRNSADREPLEPEAPPILKHLKWLWLYGLQHWKIVVVAILFVVGGSVMERLGRFGCQTAEPISKDSPNVPASGQVMRVLPVDPNTGRTTLFVTTKEWVDRRTDYLVNEKVLRWLFIGQAGSEATVTLHDGHTYSYHGFEFSGSVRDFFWSDKFIEPFLEDATHEVFDEVGKECRSNGIDPREPLKEAGGLLDGMVRRVYDKMADVDQAIRGKGFPQTAQKVDVKLKVERMTERVREYLKAATALYSDIRS